MKNNSKLSIIILNDLFCYVKYIKNIFEYYIMKEEGIKILFILLLVNDRVRETIVLFNVFIFFKFI